MEYKGYSAKVEVDEKAGVIHGEVLGIRDVVTFEARTVTQLRKAFHDSVDYYLDFCKQSGNSPEPACVTISVTISAEHILRNPRWDDVAESVYEGYLFRAQSSAGKANALRS